MRAFNIVTRKNNYIIVETHYIVYSIINRY